MKKHKKNPLSLKYGLKVIYHIVLRTAIRKKKMKKLEYLLQFYWTQPVLIQRIDHKAHRKKTDIYLLI